MLISLSIRDVVLIERLDLSFAAGLTVLTGETGAGKSILLDSLGLALGARSDAGLVRNGAEQASVAAVFHPPAGHPALALLEEQGIEAEDEIVLRRVVGRDGRSRAFANDQPVGAALLKRVGALLVVVQGQGDQMGLADPAGHAGLLDAFGVEVELWREVGALYRAWRAEVSALAAAVSELTPRDRRSGGPAAALRAASRALQRLGTGDAAQPAAPAMAALERAEEALAEAENLLSRLAADAQADPRQLEAAEERLFALRGAARKYNVLVADLPAHLADLRERLAALEMGTAELEALQRRSAAARKAYVAACGRLSAARSGAAKRLEKAIAIELPPLKLERARFVAEVLPLDEAGWGAGGADQVRFLISTNPGQTPGALAKVASGGELSRLMLALKVVLAGGSPVPTLVFDEVDSGIGGATAAAVGERLARVADSVQVLLVTHSPQVAARGVSHLRVAKSTGAGRAETFVEPLQGMERREEIARMLAGEVVTEAARAAADSLMGGA